MKANEFYVEHADGSLEYTEKGKKTLGPIVAEAGKTLDEVTSKAELERLVDQSVELSLGEIFDDEEE